MHAHYMVGLLWWEEHTFGVIDSLGFYKDFRFLTIFKHFLAKNSTFSITT